MLDTTNYDALQKLKLLYEAELSSVQQRLEELESAQKQLNKIQPLTPETVSIIESVGELINAYNLTLVKVQYNLTLISHQLHSIESHLTN